MADKYVRLSMNDAQLYLAGKTLDISVWDGESKLGTLRFGKAGLSWKVGKHESEKVRWSKLGELLDQ
jgi:hypothetical protein